MLAFSDADLNALSTGHELDLVVLSVIVAVLASFTALQVAGRIRQSTGRMWWIWLSAAAVAMGGGIWSMHFIGMLAFRLPIAVVYHTGTTLLSLLIAIVFTALGLAINNSFRDNRWVLLISGVLMGLGIASMHYTGMAAMRMEADLFYRPDLFAASVVIAIVTSTIALKLASLRQSTLYKAIAAPVMGAAIAGMHYTAMAGTLCVSTPAASLQRMSYAPQNELALMIAIGTAIIMGIGLMSAALDQRVVAAAQRETELVKRERRRLLALLENTHDQVLVLAEGRRIMFAAARALAHDDQTLIGRDFLDLLGDEEREGTEAAIRNVGEAPDEVSRDICILDRDGVLRAYEMHLADLRGDPAVEGLVVTLNDVTERRQATMRMENARQIAERASRVKSEFIAMISHELRTPLNAIIGFSEILSDETFGPVGHSRYKGYSRDILNSGRHLLGIVENIIDISRIEADEISLAERSISLEELVGDSMTLLGRGDGAVSSVSIGWEPLNPSPTLHGDPLKLRQILVNLLANAVKFSPPDGTVTVRARRRPDGSLEIAVEDNGEGIAPEMIERVREPFVQGDSSLSRRYEGSGLGLSIACGFARAHGGDIDLRSAPGRGTEAVLIMPAARVAAALEEPEAISEPER